MKYSEFKCEALVTQELYDKMFHSIIVCPIST